jgi:hypothetical protein
MESPTLQRRAGCDGRELRGRMEMGTSHASGQEATLWQMAKPAGITRKGFLRLLGTGGSAAVLMTLASGRSTAQAQAPMRLFFKADYAEYFHKPWATHRKRVLGRLGLHRRP